MKKIYWVLIVVGVLIIVGFLFYQIFGTGRTYYYNDNSILVLGLDKKVLDLYNQKKAEGMIFNSQCLGIVSGYDGVYVVDIVHVPRTAEDDLAENQCEAYKNESVSHFIELDKDGNVVRIN